HKGLYRNIYGELPSDYYTLHLGQANLVRMGESISIVTYGAGVHWALVVLDRHHDFASELLDLRTLQRLDMEAVLATVKRTGQLLILHEDRLFGGIGSDVPSAVM